MSLFNTADYSAALRQEAQSIRHITELLASLSPAQAPQTRSQAKRKRTPSPTPPAPVLEPTPIETLHVDDMDEEQVWAQLELKNKSLCETLEYALDAAGEDPEMLDAEAVAGSDSSEEEGDEVEFSEEGGVSDEDEDEDSEDDEEEEDDESDGQGDESLGDSVMNLRDPEDEAAGLPTLFSHIESALEKPKPPRRSGKKSELDDGFFSLADFNAETKQAEARKVSRGSLGGDDDDDDDDDEDEDMEGIDLFNVIDGIDDDDGEGMSGDSLYDTPKLIDTIEPTYKDFFAPPPKAQRQPKPSSPKKSGRVRFHEEVKVRNVKARGKNLPTNTISMLGGNDDDDDDDDGDEDDELDEGNVAFDTMEEGDEDEEGLEGDDRDDDMDVDPLMNLDGDEDEDVDEGEDEEETMDRFQDDLFAEEEQADEDGSGQSTLHMISHVAEQLPELTTHEKRQAALRAQIEELESENVAKKNWTLMGEATARSRPQNSLLEEDLEFERVAKVVPVVTEEVVQRLEDRIKARIAAGQFDDVVRQRASDDRPFLPSRMFELQDSKSKQSLAEIYEGEYVAAQTGGVAGEDRDGKLRKEHEELTTIWDNICYKLDALCNAHFTPKQVRHVELTGLSYLLMRPQPKAIISTMSNVAAASMESALPTTKSTTSMLAPEEVFAPSSSELRARSELTPEEKRAQHNKHKKSKRKQRDALDSATVKAANGKNAQSVKKQKEEALKSVVKTGRGVTVVGKKSKDAKTARRPLK
jgi:U3 small nucleolar RNA-associated protein MPP10